MFVLKNILKWFFNMNPSPSSNANNNDNNNINNTNHSIGSGVSLPSFSHTQPIPIQTPSEIEQKELAGFLSSPLWRFTTPPIRGAPPMSLRATPVMISTMSHSQTSTSSLMSASEETDSTFMAPPHDISTEYPILQIKSYAIHYQDNFSKFLEHVAEQLGLNPETIVNSLQASARRFQNTPPVGVSLTDVDVQDAFLAHYCRELTENLQTGLIQTPNFLLTNMGMKPECNEYVCYPPDTKEEDRHRFAMNIMTFLFDAIPRFRINYPRPLEALSTQGVWQRFHFSSDFYLANDHPQHRLTPYWLFFQTQSGPNPFWSWPHPDSIHADPETFTLQYQIMMAQATSTSVDESDDSKSVPQLTQPSLSQIPKFIHPKGKYPYKFVYLVDFWYNQLYYTEWIFNASGASSQDKRLGPSHGIRFPPIFRMSSSYEEAIKLGSFMHHQKVVKKHTDSHFTKIMMMVRYLVPSHLIVAPQSIDFNVLRNWFPYKAGVILWPCDTFEYPNYD